MHAGIRPVLAIGEDSKSHFLHFSGPGGWFSSLGVCSEGVLGWGGRLSRGQCQTVHVFGLLGIPCIAQTKLGISGV